MDVLLVVGDIAFPHRPGGRSYVCVESSAAVEEALDRIEADSVTVVAGWHDLTVGVSRCLAEWAARSERRGFGLLPADLAIAPGPSAWPLARPHVLLFGQSRHAIIDSSGPRESSEEALLQDLSDSGMALGVAFSGHGAEHCVSMGQRWMTTDSRIGLRGELVTPDRVSAAVVFLNTCASLRLGDSTIPMDTSLAAAFYRRGSAVIGSFRNLSSFPEAADMFARGLLDGLPLGRIVNSLNRAASQLAIQDTPFSMLGDALSAPDSLISIGAATSVANRMPTHRAISGRVLTRISNDLSAFEHLCASVRRWVDIDSTERSLATFSELSRAVFQSQHPLICGRLADAEIRELVASANNALVQCRASLVCDLAVGISQGEWLQTKFAPVSRDERLSDVRCPRCNGRNLRTVHRARGRRLLSVISEDCDRCGTLVEYVGRPWRRPLVFASEDSHNLRVDVPPLRSGECGVVLINRARDLPSITWPAAGGTITFPLDAIGFRGRVTVVALSCGRRELAASYHTIFVPLVDQATAGSSSVTVPA